MMSYGDKFWKAESGMDLHELTGPLPSEITGKDQPYLGSEGNHELGDQVALVGTNFGSFLET